MNALSIFSIKALYYIVIYKYIYTFISYLERYNYSRLLMENVKHNLLWLKSI